MAAQRGRDLLLKVDQSGSGTFLTLAGLRSRTFSVNAEMIDITNADSAGQWRELLAGGGIRRAAIAGGGIFRDAASDALMRDMAFNGDIRSWQIIIPDFGQVEGLFQITSFELAGEHAGAVTFDLALESAGQLAFTAL